MLLVHVVHGSPEMVGDADSICSLRAGISLALLWGLHPCWQCGGLMICLSPLALWTLAPLTRLAGGSLTGVSTGIVDASSIDQVSWWLPYWNYGAY